jgi:REP element-mobilizing transposase RayT
VAQGPALRVRTAGQTARRQFRRFLESRCYFVTTNTHERRQIFIRDSACRIVLHNLEFYRDRGDFWLHAYVIMPDHLHVLLTPLRHDLSSVMRNLKSFIARQLIDDLNDSPPVWQTRFHDQVIRSERHFASAVEYTHLNPVKAGLCAAPDAYPYSSSGAFAGTSRPPLAVQALDGSRLGP